MDNTEVLVVGAGPTGLLLAGDLARAGVRVTVLERRTAERSNLTRAFAVHARTLEELDARGVADELVATGRSVQSLRLFGKIEVSLAGLPSRFPFVLVTPQYRTEEVLLRRAVRAGATVCRGAELVALRQDSAGVEAEVRDQQNRVDTWRADYLVGADGVHSAVRGALGVAFPGRSVVRSLMLADVRLAEPPSSVLTVDSNGEAFAFLVPFGDGWYRVITFDRRDQRPDHAPVDLDEVRAGVVAVFGTDFGMHDARWLSRFHSDERQVGNYRVGRVLLAGDAAHVHSPAGGQGMNTGLQDAADLGWRLAGVVRGWGSAAMLDEYHTERHAVGRKVVRGSGALLRMALLRPALLRAARAAVLGTALRVEPVAGRMALALSGVAIRYPAPRGGHRTVGARVPDLELTGGGRLYEALRDGGFVMVAGAQGGRLDAEALAAQYGWRGPVTRVSAVTPPKLDLLVRPDGYLASAQ